MSQSKRLSFRPHHFFCTLAYEGKGYSDAFVANYDVITRNLTDDTEIEVVTYTDDICAPCPHRKGTLCEKEGFIQQLDAKHAEALSLKRGDVVTWRNAKARLKTLTVEDHRAICAGCEWQQYGMCERALVNLKTSR